MATKSLKRATGAEALDHLLEGSLRSAVVDIRMPVMDAIAACDRVGLKT